jgi:nitroreductase
MFCAGLNDLVFKQYVTRERSKGAYIALIGAIWALFFYAMGSVSGGVRFDHDSVFYGLISGAVTIIANILLLEAFRGVDASVKRQLEALLFKPNRASIGVLEAPVTLALCGKLASSGYYKGEIITRWGDWILFDCGLATQNLCLMAHSLGLGTVIIGAFDHKSTEKLLGVPEGYSIVCLIPLGYPAVNPSPPQRKQIKEFTHVGTFSK